MKGRSKNRRKRVTSSPPSSSPGLPRARRILFRTASLVLAAAAALLLAETVYRVVLGYSLRDSHPSFTVDSDSIYEFDEHFGYRYVANRTATRIRIVDGYPASIETLRVNALGNIGRGPEDWGDAEFKIMVFGDSFTANPDHGGIAWPDYLSGDLRAATGMQTSVINFGRDGYGTLQMFDLAATMVPRGRPDLAIFAMIADDLSRARSWRSTRRIEGETRVLISIEPDPDSDPRRCVDRGIYHPEATGAWFTSLEREYRPDDPTLGKILEQYRRLSRENLHLDLFTPGTSYLLDRIRFGDPLRSVYQPSRNPRLPFSDLARDAGFLDCVAVLRNTDIPAMMILLPTLNDLRNQGYVMDSQEKNLLVSLRSTTELHLVELRRFVRVPEAEWPDLYLPGDGHPSRRGAEVFAEAITELIADALRREQETSETGP